MTPDRVLLGRLTTPKLVADMLDRLGELSPTAFRGCERVYKLSYYFGGLVVATRETDDGTEIVFSGPIEEVAEGVKRLSRAEAESLLIFSPDLLEVHLAGLPRAERRR